MTNEIVKTDSNNQLASMADMRAMVAQVVKSQAAVDAATPGKSWYFKMKTHAAFDAGDQKNGATPFYVKKGDDKLEIPVDTVWFVDIGTFKRGYCGYKSDDDKVPDTFVALWSEKPVDRDAIKAAHPHVTKPRTEWTMVAVESSDPSVIGTVAKLTDNKWSVGYRNLVDVLRDRIFEINKHIQAQDMAAAQELFNTRFLLVRFDCDVGVEVTGKDKKQYTVNKMIVEQTGWSGPVAVTDADAPEEAPELDEEDDSTLEEALEEEPEVKATPRARVKKSEFQKPARKVVARKRQV